MTDETPHDHWFTGRRRHNFSPDPEGFCLKCPAHDGHNAPKDTP